MARILTDKEINSLPDAMKMNGILQPLWQHRFRILYGSLTHAEADLMTMQTVSLEFDLVHDRYVLTIEQPLYGFVGEQSEMIVPTASAFLQAVKNLCMSRCFHIRAEILDGNITVVDNLINEEVHAIHHESSLDYASAKVMKHVLTLKRGMRQLD